MNQTAFQCTKCSAMWTRRTLFDDACPECKGELRDITHTHNGQEFLRIIRPPAEIQSTNMDAKIYATGPSSLFSLDGGKSS